MASVPLCESALGAVKKSLRCQLPDVRSAHITEALAAALGRRTHAALLADLKTQPPGDPDIELLDDILFDKRLQDFGYPGDPDFSFDFVDEPALINTFHSSAFEVEYRTARERAWRNLMVCGINEGIRRRLFTVRPGDNRWPAALAHPKDSHERVRGHLYDFFLPNGLPARAYVGDAGFNELAIHVAANPIGDWVQASNAGFHAGDALARGWLERESGAWMQSSTSLFTCRRPLLQPLADIEVRPFGYGDRGRVIM